MKLELLEKNIKYCFKNKYWIKNALTHPSYSSTEFENLEFLGDRVIALAVSDMLFKKKLSLKDMSRIFNNLVNKDILLKVAKLWNVEVFFNHEIKEVSKKVKTDIVEAIIGGIYLDSNYEVAREFIEEHWQDLFIKQENVFESKMKLQEYTQAKGFELPIYESVEVKGENHNPTHKIRVIVKTLGSAIAEGKNKQEASKKAAEIMLNKIC